MPEFSDETLMRFADGELDAQTAAEVEAAINGDDRLAARAALFMETRATVQKALAPLADEPVPENLRRAVENMVERSRADRTAAQRPRVARQWFPANDWRPAAAAAAIAATVGLAAGIWLDSPGSSDRATLAAIEDPALQSALVTVPSGEESAIAGGRFRAIASLRDGAQNLCREFEVDRTGGPTEVALACRQDGNWTIRLAVAAPATDQGYAPASSLEALDAYISSIGGSDVLDPEEERQALSEIRAE